MGEFISIPSSEPVEAYLAHPKGDIKAAVIVIHEVWGVDDHIKSVADRLANEGYLALAPDFLSSADIDLGKLRGLMPGLFDPEKRNEIQPELRRIMAPMQNPEFGIQTSASLKDCFNYLYNLPDINSKVVVMGFCFGGTYSFNLAIEEPNLSAAIAFYGHADQDEKELSRINCPVRAFYGENDERLINGLPEFRKRMKSAGVNFVDKVYPNCGHAFFNDTNPYAYNRKAAEDAWKITLKMIKDSIQ